MHTLLCADPAVVAARGQETSDLSESPVGKSADGSKDEQRERNHNYTHLNQYERQILRMEFCFVNSIASAADTVPIDDRFDFA